MKIQKDRKTERQKDRKTERQKDRKTERQKYRKTVRPVPTERMSFNYIIEDADETTFKNFIYLIVYNKLLYSVCT